MTWTYTRPWLGTVIRLGLGFVWIWASLEKLSNPRRFVQDVRAYDATPEWLSKAIGYGLPVLEFSLGALLIVGLAVRMSAIVSGLLFLVFVAGLVQAAARDIKLECGCFGGGGVTAGSTHYTLEILRDVGLLALAVFLVLWPMTRISVDEYLARNDYVEPPSAKRMRSEGGIRKYNAMVQLKQKQARERSLWLNSALSAIVAVVAVIGIGVQSGRAKIEGSLAAANASAGNGVVFGKAAAATVDIYEDFQCPNCRDFEKAVHTSLEADVRANKAQVRYHTMAFLDSASNGNRYSSRAANAAVCASDASIDIFVKYHDVLFQPDVQPKEGSDGLSDTKLIELGTQAGMTPDQITAFTTCVQTEQHKALVEAITEKASENGVNGTPTVIVNGKRIDATLDALNKAIADALKKGPAPSPSVTPPPTSPATSPSASTSPSATTTK